MKRYLGLKDSRIVTQDSSDRLYVTRVFRGKRERVQSYNWRLRENGISVPHGARKFRLTVREVGPTIFAATHKVISVGTGMTALTAVQETGNFKFVTFCYLGRKWVDRFVNVKTEVIA